MTPQEFKDSNGLSYSKLGTLFGCSKARAYNICRERGGSLRIQEVNRIVSGTRGDVKLKDLGLEVTHGQRD